MSIFIIAEVTGGNRSKLAPFLCSSDDVSTSGGNRDPVGPGSRTGSNLVKLHIYRDVDNSLCQCTSVGYAFNYRYGR